MNSFFSSLTMGLFGQAMEDEQGVNDETGGLELGMDAEDDRCRKRVRRCGGSDGSRTPTLVAIEENGKQQSWTEESRAVKRRRGIDGRIHKIVVLQKEDNKKSDKTASGEGASLADLPEDLVAQCLSFIGGVEDRFALQCTNKQFRRISNSDDMLIGIQVGGDKDTGLNGIITEDDTPESATDKLTLYAVAGNLEAIYMIGIIKSYCGQGVECGVNILKAAAAQGYVRASYALGLVLRDSHPKEATEYMAAAASARYIPALQEVLPPRQMKAQFGEPCAEELRRHLDPLCLNRLLSRHYVKSADLREVNTSHCWNPLCGRWAFKAVTVAPGAIRGFRHRRHAAHRAAALSRHHENIDLSDPVPAETNDASAPTMFNLSGVSPINNATSNNNAVSESDTPRSLDVRDVRVSRMKMCSRCCRAKYCSKLCQVYDWRSGRHKMECQFL